MICFQGITKIYKDTEVFRNFNMELAENQISCIMGKSGSGKTTLFRMLMGLTKPDEGTIKGLPGKRISAVFQENRLCSQLSAVGNIQLVTKDLASSRIEAELHILLTEDCLSKPVSELSGGMKRRVAIARAMIAESDIILMDEPFTGLDEETKAAVINYIRANRRDRTLCIITHIMDETALFPEARIMRLKE